MSRRTTSSRRRAAATVAGSLGLLLAAVLLPAAPASAATPDGWPVDEWAATCADIEDQYCIEQATLTPVGGEPTPAAGLGLSASATTVPGDYPSFDWAVDGWSDELDDVTGGDLTLVIRTGQYVPRFSTATAEGMRITRVVDEAGNYTMTVTGRPAHIDWTTGEFEESCFALQHCGEDDVMADDVGYRFSGNTTDLDGNSQDYIDTIDGAYLATDAQARTGVISYYADPDPYLWIGVIGNPHLDIAGKPVRGSFNAWLPGTYFASVGMTAEEAVETGFDLIDGSNVDFPVSVPASASVVGDGVDLSATDLRYGMHMFTVFHRPSGAAEGATVPDAPYGLEATAEFGDITAQWTAPEDDGGHPIAGYNLRAFTEATGGAIAGRCQPMPGDDDDSDEPSQLTLGDDNDGNDDGDDDDDGSSDDATSCTLYGLDEGATYYLAVSAFNALGEGDADGDRLAVTTSAPGATPPSAPKAVKVVAGARRLTANWALPDEDNGAPITEYTATAFSTLQGLEPVDTCTAYAPLRTCALTHLANGTKYYVGVTATNDAGEGPESLVRAAGAPRTVPSAPRSLSVSSSKGKAKVGWAAPSSTGGAAVTGYRVNIYAARTGGKDAAHCTTTASVRTCTVSGLKAGRTYYVSVNAQNVAGASVEPVRSKVQIRN